MNLGAFCAAPLPSWGRPGLCGSAQSALGRRRLAGVSLLEMLVVLVLASLLSTLLIQGLGFFLSGMEAVQRHSGRAAAAALPQRWFDSTVGAMVPHVVSSRNFIGDADAFEGVTLASLTGAPGLPRRIRWSIDDGETVRYAEDDAFDWAVLQAPGDALRFEYAGLDGEWRSQWRAAPLFRQWTPRQVRLTAEDGRVHWLTSLDLHPVPVLNFRMVDQIMGEDP